MKISREEYKNIRYICKKFNISPESFRIKTLAATLDKRLLRRRFVVCFAVKHTRVGHFLVWNSLKRIDIRDRFLKKNAQTSHKQIKNKKHIKWRRAVRKVRKLEPIKTEEQEELLEENEIETHEVRDKLKEQLQLLQQGKKNKFIEEISLDPVCNGTVHSPKSSKCSSNGMIGECIDDFDEMESLRVTPDITSECEEKAIDDQNDYKTPEKEDADSETHEETPKLSDTGYNSPAVTPSKKGFLDSLLNKFKTTDVITEKPLTRASMKAKEIVVEEEIVQEQMLPEPILIPMAVEPEPRTTRMRARKSFHQIKRDSESSQKNDLFKLGERSVPGLLATPKAKNTKVSAFVDQETAAEVKIKLEKMDDDSTNFDQKEHEGLVCSGIKPPHLEKPKKFMDLERPRTVYEKRQLMQKKKGIKFLMMENESKIYNELAKINREDYDYQFNFPMLTALQKETVPYRRDAWRALSFLKTEKNRFFYKVLFIDGIKCNLLGSRGNFDGKKKFKTTSSPFPKYLAYKNKNPCCKPIRMPKNVKFNLNIPSDEPEEHASSKKLLDYDKTMLNMKPAPLSVKLRKQTSRLSTDECLGPLELYTMPTVELEVHPKVGRQLDPKIHPYLKYLLPYENITETWARFSVSLLKEGEKNEDEMDKKFSFPIPYSNNQNKIMVRRRKEIAQSINISIEDKELVEDLEKPLTFTNVIKENDKLGQEIGEILTEMTNSVAIGLSDSSFIQNDPDLDYTLNDKPLEVAPVKAVKETVLSKKIVRELRKLNATFITAAENPTTKCSEKYCEQGCLCESLTTSLIFKNHCKKQDCMIECKCASNRFHQEDIKDCNFTSDEVQSLREKATARLAPMEKDFTPTLVLSNNSTYLIPGSDREHSRRSKKVPARYSDYVDPSSKSSALGDEGSEIVPLTEITKTKFTPKDPLEAAVFQMKHCSVVLRPLNHVSQIEPWCMVHRLYKCFCNGQAIEGRPFTFDDLEEGLMERYEYGNRKPRYEFERNDARMPLKRDRRMSSGSNSVNTSPNAKIRRTSTGRDSMFDLDSLDLVRIDTNTAQRCFPIDRKYVKRDPRETNLKKTAIKKYEEKHSYTEALLKQRLEECERHFHRELRRKLEQTSKKTIEHEEKTEDENDDGEQELTPSKKKHRLTRPIRLNIRNSPEEIMTISMLKPLITKNVILVATGKNKIYAKKDYFYAGKLDFTKVMKKTKNTIFIIEKTDEEVANCSDFLRFNPLIRRTKLVDLKLIINIILQPENEKANDFSFDLSSSQKQELQETTESEQEIPPSQNSLSIEPSEASEIGKKKVQHINAMISRAMQYICKLQKQNAPTLVEPTQSKMYFFTWRCMIQGFLQGLLTVWEIRCIGNRCAVVVTQVGVCPTIEYMEEIKNIRDCTVETPGLSLYSKMLLLKVDNEKTKNLSLVLYGGVNFWRITGFVNSETNYQQHGIIARPTPQTHPVLSAKINHLFNMLHNRRESEINFDEVPVEKPKKLPVKPPVYKTNIKICSTDNMPSIRSLFLPIPEVAHQRWFMLQIENDFSDIFIPNWEDYLSYDKVTYALQLAKTHSKTVRVTMNDKFPEIYATPRRSNCIFFGPYSMKGDIDYVLCQNVDGRIIDRETYEEKYKVKRDRATIGSWLYPKRDGDSTSPEGEPSPKVRKVLVKKKMLDKTVIEKPSFVISQVQTAITDPKLIPKNESSDEENAAKRLQLKRLSREMINNDLKRQKTENQANPLKVTLLKKAGDGGYAIKPSTTGPKPLQVVKRASLPEAGITDHKLTGKRISLPLSAVKSMKTMVLQKGVSLMKTNPTVVAPNPTQVKRVNKPVVVQNASDKPSTSKELIRPNVVKRLAIKTNSGVQITSVVRNTDDVEQKKVNEGPPLPVIKIEKTTVENKKVQNIQKTLPSSITVRSVTPDQNNKKESSAITAIKTITIKPDAKSTLPMKPDVVIKKEDEKVSATNKVSSNSNTSTTSTVPTTETDVIHGFYISNVLAIGRIIAEKRVNKLILKMRNSDGYYVRRQFMTGQSILYLNRYLRGLVHSFIPENFMLNWRFETNKDIVDKYPEHDPNKVPRKMIITRQGGVSLKQTWEQLAYLEKYDKNQYLKILLIKLADDCFPEQKFANWDVLQILQTSQKEILDLETKALRLIKVKSEEEEKHADLLLKLDALKMLYPDVKLPSSKSTGSVNNKEQIEDTDDDDVVEVVSVKKGIEVICLSDDD